MCNAPTLSCIIAIHKNKVTTKKLQTREEGKTKVAGKVEVKEKEEEEEVEEVEEIEPPLKRKRHGEEEASGSKKEKSQRPRTRRTYCLSRPPEFKILQRPR
uniref:Uncharacterized protein n=1 Tax=Cucumis melo TaxID=3656 RepID=A0A9I9D900_CUCME